MKATVSSWLLYHNPGKFLDGRKERIRFALFVVGLMFLSRWVGQNVLVEPPAKWYHDFQLRRRPKAQEHLTRIVHIDSEDHERLFGGMSPLPGAAIVQAACAVAARGPSVVVVDLDTSSSSVFPEGLRLPRSSVPIVWAVDTTWQAEGKEGLVQKADPVLGGRLATQPLYGIATMPADFDGVVRFWTSFESIDGSPRPTLPWAAVQEYCRLGHDKCPKGNAEQVETHPPAFTTEIRFQSIRLSDFLTEPPKEFPASCPILPPDPRLKGRIIVLGGSYSRADLHETPWGSRQGAELVAMAIEQVFDPAPLRELAEYFLVGLELAIAILIAAIHHWIRPIPALLFTLVFLPVGVIISAELMFLFGDYEVGIVPFIVGMLIHQLVGSAERAEHKARRLEQADTLVSGGIG